MYDYPLYVQNGKHECILSITATGDIIHRGKLLANDPEIAMILNSVAQTMKGQNDENIAN